MPGVAEVSRCSTVVGSYVTSAGERELCARVENRHTTLTDEPVNGLGLSYLVEVIPASDGPGAVAAIVELYLEEARATRSIPMARTILNADLVVIA